jgi:iron-sulfur cluster assembly accessory protein
MGTFHTDKSALHGITVVVDTKGPKVYVGRCDDEDEAKVILVDADVHEDGQNGKSKQQYVERSAKFGVWKKLDHVVIPRSEVTSITKLGEVFDKQRAAAPVASAPVNSPAPSAAAVASTVKPDVAQHIVLLTPAAQVEVKRLIDSENKPGLGLRLAENKPGLGLRLGVKGGGCSGFVYKLDFDQKREGDVVVDYGEVKVYLDKKSTIYLRGITLDHQKGLQGRGFVFHNPNASNTCGCGESFAV